MLEDVACEGASMNDWQPIPRHVQTLAHVESVLLEGCEILFAEEAEGVFLKVVLRDEQVGYFSFSVDQTESRIRASQASVAKDHQRNGIARACYLCAAKLTGFTFQPGSPQTADGRKFWAKMKEVFPMYSVDFCEQVSP